MDRDACEFHAPSGSWIAEDFVHGARIELGLQCIIDAHVVADLDTPNCA